MRRLHLVAVVAGLAAAVIGVRLLLGGGTPRSADRDGDPGAAQGGAAGDAPRRSQIELLDGPPTRPDTTVAPQMGALRTPQELEAERRAQGLRETLSNLQGAPVYVEGVDGPAPQRR